MTCSTFEAAVTLEQGNLFAEDAPATFEYEYDAYGIADITLVSAEMGLEIKDRSALISMFGLHEVLKAEACEIIAERAREDLQGQRESDEYHAKAWAAE